MQNFPPLPILTIHAQDVNMVVGASDHHGRRIKIPTRSCEMSVEPPAEIFVIHDRSPIDCRMDHMQIGLDQQLRHGNSFY